MATTRHALRADWDAIVIGSGMGGMTAAAYLAANGRRTLVLEQGEVLGGCTHVFRRKGLEFDVGVHYLGDCGRPEGSIPSMLRGVGADKRVEFREVDPDGFDVLAYPSVTFKVPKGWDTYRDRLLDTFPDDAKALNRYVTIIRKLADSIDRAMTPSSPRELARTLWRAKWAAPLSIVPLERLFELCRVSPLARLVLAGQTPAYASPATRVPAIVQAAYLKSYVEGGAYFPVGGGQVLAATMVEVLQANGGQFRLNARVNGILVDNEQVRGVTLSGGETITAPVVVSNADLKRTYLELIDPAAVPALTRKRVSGYRMAWPLFTTYLALDVDLSRTMSSAQIWKFSADGDFGSHQKNIGWAECGRDRQRWLQALRQHAGAMIHISTNKDPDTAFAPPGHSIVEVMTYVPPDHDLWGVSEGGPVHGEKYRTNAAYLELKEAVTDIMVDLAAQVLPDLREHIVWKEASTPITQERYTQSSAGGSYGIELNVTQVGPLRPQPKTRITGLYLAGASLGWGPGVEGVMLSGVGAAGAVLGRDLFDEIRAGAVFGKADQLPERSAEWDPLAVAVDSSLRGGRVRAVKTR